MKNTFDKVVSTGCSFSRDLNINDIENIDKDEDMGFLYPQLVADKLNAECINLSMSGADNEYIIHTILDYAQNNDNKNTLYLIQFTYMWRLGFPTRSIETANKNWVKGVVDMEKVSWASLRPINESQGVPDQDKFYETYIKHFYHEDICLKIFLQKISLLKAWFEFHNISYKFLTTTQRNYRKKKSERGIEGIEHPKSPFIKTMSGISFMFDIARTMLSYHRMQDKTEVLDLMFHEDKNEKKFIEFCSNNNFVEFTKDLFYIDYWATLNNLNTYKDIHLTKEGHEILSDLILEK